MLKVYGFKKSYAKKAVRRKLIRLFNWFARRGVYIYDVYFQADCEPIEVDEATIVFDYFRNQKQYIESEEE